MYSPCLNSVRSSASTSPQKSKKIKTSIPCLDYINESRIPHRGLGDSSQHFTIADYQRLQNLSKPEIAFDPNWLIKITPIAPDEAVAPGERMRLHIWVSDDDGGCYRPLLGQLHRHEAIALLKQYDKARDKQRFIRRLEYWIDFVIKQCSAEMAGEVAA